MKYYFSTIIVAGLVFLSLGAIQAQQQGTAIQQETGNGNVTSLEEMPVQMQVQTQTQTQVQVQTQTEMQTMQITASARPQCGTNVDCSGIVCPQAVGQDAPQCNLKTNTCFCGPGPSAERITAVSGQALIHPQLRVAQPEEIRQPVVENRLISANAEEIKEIAAQHQQTFQERKILLQGETEQRAQEAEEKALLLRAQHAEEIEAKKEQFEERVMQMMEERKQTLAVQHSERINMVNGNRTDAYLNYLDAIELVLDKLEARAQIIGDATGTDMTAFLDEIASANSKIEEAREAVIAQKSKEYVLEINSETSMGEDIFATVRELYGDYSSLKVNVLDPIRHLVRDLIQVLRDTVSAAGDEVEETLNVQAE